MKLGELITTLEAVLRTAGDKTCKRGINGAHSYRGYYDELAFSLGDDVTVGEMLAVARSCVGKTFRGWKGGDFKMTEDTDCWIAEDGCSGESLGQLALSCLLNDCPTLPAPQ